MELNLLNPDPTFIQWLWYALVGVLFVGYAVLDGFDLGIGVLYPFLGKDAREKGALRNSIGPVWDGNEVWLITAGGALFAAFPFAYAFAFSGFYLAIMLVLFGLILRAVALEFRAKDTKWGSLWDGLFFVGSLLPALLFGVAVGNIIRGVPMVAPPGGGIGGVQLDYAGTFLQLLNPYALLVGVLGLAMFLTQGAAWGAVKTKGALHDRCVAARSWLHWALAALFVVTGIATWFVADYHIRNVVERWYFGVPALLLVILGIAYSRKAMTGTNHDHRAFMGSSAAAAGMVLLWGIGTYPAMIPRKAMPGFGVTADVSSSNLTLGVMLVFVIVFLPAVLFYTSWVYRTFGGKVDENTLEY